MMEEAIAALKAEIQRLEAEYDATQGFYKLCDIADRLKGLDCAVKFLTSQLPGYSEIIA